MSAAGHFCAAFKLWQLAPRAFAGCSSFWVLASLSQLCRLLRKLLLCSCHLACHLGILCRCRVCYSPAVLNLDGRMHAACCSDLAAWCGLAEACKSARCALICCQLWQSRGWAICCRLPGSQATPSLQAAASTTHGMFCKRVVQMQPSAVPACRAAQDDLMGWLMRHTSWRPAPTVLQLGSRWCSVPGRSSGCRSKGTHSTGVLTLRLRTGGSCLGCPSCSLEGKLVDNHLHCVTKLYFALVGPASSTFSCTSHHACLPLPAAAAALLGGQQSDARHELSTLAAAAPSCLPACLPHLPVLHRLL